MNPLEALHVMSDRDATENEIGGRIADSVAMDRLVARAQGGDVEAVGALYDKHHGTIFRYLRLRTSDQQAAEDLTGEVFIRMLQALQQTGLPFRAWLFRIARNLLVDHYRKPADRRAIAIEEAEAPREPGSEPDRALDTKLTLERLSRELSTIDATQRDVVVLRFLSGLSIRETAKVLGKTEAAVKALQHRGLRALRKGLTQVQG